MKLPASLLACILAVGCSSADDPATEVTSNDGGADSALIGPDPLGNPVDKDGAPDAGNTAPDAPTGNPDTGTPAADGGPVNAFTGAPAFAATLGPSARSNKHTPANPAGQACLTCHDGSRGNVRELLFAGTVTKDAAGQVPAPSNEVRVRGANGAALSAFTDADGNFFFERGARPPLSSPARAGTRNATTTELMTNLINNGDCNSCHRAGGQPRLVLP